MSRSHRSTLVVTAAALAAWCAAPAPAEAQGVFKKIRDQAARRIEEHKAKVDSTVLSTAAGVVDSTLDKTGRGVDAVANKVGSVADTAIARTEHGVTSAFKGGGGSDALAAQIAAGHAVLREIHFAPNSDQLDASSEAAVKQLARALASTAGIFLIEGHTDAMPDAAAAHALSERRAAALKGRLVADGVPAARLLALGHGATRPATDDPTRSARIELTRAQ